jgi:hypothetical protein
LIFSLFLWQDDSDLVFDDGIFADDETSWSSLADGLANSRVKREPPPSLEEGERRGGRHRQLVSGGDGNGVKSSSLGHWDRHHQKTKKQLHQQKHGDIKEVKQHHHRQDHHGKGVAEKKNKVVAKPNLKQLEPIKKKHDNNQSNHHNKRNNKKVPIVRKIEDDDEDFMLGDGSGSGDGETIPSPPSQGGGGSASGTRSKINFFFFFLLFVDRLFLK